MKIIAFKRAGQAFGSLHPEFITEYVDASLLPSTEGYETMIEEHFNLEFAKNEERHAKHLAYLKEQEQLKVKAEADAIQAELVKERELTREFEQFKRWKLSKEKK